MDGPSMTNMGATGESVKPYVHVRFQFSLFLINS